MNKTTFLSTAIALGVFVASTTSSMARPEYYFPYNGANFIYGSMDSCQAEAGAGNVCVDFGNYCGRRYAASQNKLNLWKTLYRENKTLVIKSRGSNNVVCNVGS